MLSDSGFSGRGDVWVGVGDRIVIKVLSITFTKGKCSTNSEKGLQEYNPFRSTSGNRKSIHCLINLLQIDFT